MLLDFKVKIKATNDGKNNNIEFDVTNNPKAIDVAYVFQNVIAALEGQIQKLAEAKEIKTQEEFFILSNNARIKDFNNKIEIIKK